MRQTRACALLSLFLCLVVTIAQGRTRGRDASIVSIEGRADRLFQQERFSEAFAAYRQAADLGSTRSETFLGYMYASGLGTQPDSAQAFNWIEKAAEQGDPRAEAMLGVLYQNGSGTAQDYAHAQTWFGKAAQKSNVSAENNLGISLPEGPGNSPGLSEGFGMVLKSGGAGIRFTRSITWARCMNRVWGRRQTMSARSCGTASPLNRDSPPLKTVWG